MHKIVRHFNPLVQFNWTSEKKATYPHQVSFSSGKKKAPDQMGETLKESLYIG
jgi:hypothetical protein